MCLPLAADKFVTGLTDFLYQMHGELVASSELVASPSIGEQGFCLVLV